jgi:hypothetical protein
MQTFEALRRLHTFFALLNLAQLRSQGKIKEINATTWTTFSQLN